MILFRLSNCSYISDLSGAGTKLFGSRWSGRGLPGVYLASSRALAILEVLVRLQPLMVPTEFCMAEMEVPDISIEHANADVLPANWNDINPPAELRKIGDDFLKAGKHLMLKLPSSIVPAESNFLLNPLHPNMAKVKMIKREPFSFDERLLHRL